MNIPLTGYMDVLINVRTLSSNLQLLQMLLGGQHDNVTCLVPLVPNLVIIGGNDLSKLYTPDTWQSFAVCDFLELFTEAIRTSTLDDFESSLRNTWKSQLDQSKQILDQLTSWLADWNLKMLELLDLTLQTIDQILDLLEKAPSGERPHFQEIQATIDRINEFRWPEPSDATGELYTDYSIHGGDFVWRRFRMAGIGESLRRQGRSLIRRRDECRDRVGIWQANPAEIVRRVCTDYQRALIDYRREIARLRDILYNISGLWSQLKKIPTEDRLFSSSSLQMLKILIINGPGFIHFPT